MSGKDRQAALDNIRLRDIARTQQRGTGKVNPQTQKGIQETNKKMGKGK